MSEPLRVLVIEDNQDDLLLLLRELRQSGYEPQHRCVETADELRQALAEGGWQIVISDWQLPAFDGMSALAIVRGIDEDLPFVIVSGTVGEEDAVLAMRAGAQDYVMKDRLARLGPAISRELGEAVVRHHRRQAEASLHRSEERFRSLIENALDLIAVLDRDGLVLYISPASKRVLGYTPDELAGHDIAAWLHPEDDAYLQSDAVGVLGGLLDGDTVTVRFRHADGHWIWLEAVGRDRTGDPSVGGVVVNARDVTQRQSDELAMARLFQAVQQTREAIVITDVQGTIEYVNPAFERITGYSAGEAIGRNPRLLKSGRHPQSFYENLWSTLLAGRTWSGRLTNRHRDGSLYEEDATISPVFDRHGEILHFVAVKRDITATLALEGQLLQAQKMEAVGRLAGGIAHDFNNLLMLLINHAEFLKDSLPVDAAQRVDVDGILGAAERATALTRQLLTFSRRELTQPEVMDLNQAINNVEKLLRHSIGEDIDVICELTSGLPPIKADPGKVEQVLMNLAINARDAMPRGGILRIRTARLPSGFKPATQTGLPAGDYVSLTVKDSGHGMTPAVAARVFEPYFTTKPRGKGTGLGLSTVFGIVTQAGGDIAVESEVGDGASFTVYLPATAETASEPVASQSETLGRGGGETILVVEDEDAVRSLTSRILEASGYTVHAAPGGKEALVFEAGFAGRIDLLLTDVVMPGMSGAELAERFVDQRPHTPVIYMSGYTADVMEAHGLADQVHVLQKPFTAGQLVRQVQASISRAREDGHKADPG